MKQGVLFNLMHEKYPINEVPSATRLAAASRDNRYNVEIDELDKKTAEQIKQICARNKFLSRIESDPASGQYTISITNADLSVIEKIEVILSSTEQ